MNEEERGEHCLVFHFDGVDAARDATDYLLGNELEAERWDAAVVVLVPRHR